MKWRVLGVVLLVGVLSALFAGGALADHCTGDKDHLGDGSCGYVVQPVQPSPSPGTTPIPWPVNVENVPTVEIKPKDGADPIPVEITNPPETDPTSGWNSSDREMLASLLDQVQHTRLMLVLVGALSLFALGLVVVFLVPRVR
ncbi:MAG: hypothetical protein GEU78_16110 [Actinobacteria bacterium]|nr:hypothetical protein [Actinomycetota bacterium]